jgi:hypothetical protein
VCVDSGEYETPIAKNPASGLFDGAAARRPGVQEISSPSHPSELPAGWIAKRGALARKAKRAASRLLSIHLPHCGAAFTPRFISLPPR